ncbi:MAG: hypothetical protein ACRCYR_01930 [Phycicoccus sp.]
MVHGLPPRGDVILVPEMPSPLGLPDFLAAVSVEAWLARRDLVEIPPVLSEIDCSVLAVLNANRPLSVKSVGRRLGWTPAEAERVVDRLTRSRAVVTTAGGALLRVRAFDPKGSLIAVEAKLNGWQQAVRQGRGYRTWASNYVVVLGEVGEVARRRAAAEVITDGAGLFNGTGWVVRPAARQPSVARRILGLEHLYAAVASSPSL